MFQQHLAIFHKSRPFAGVVPTLMALSDQWFLQKLSRTGEAKWGGAENNLGGAFAPPPPLAPPWRRHWPLITEEINSQHTF